MNMLTGTSPERHSLEWISTARATPVMRMALHPRRPSMRPHWSRQNPAPAAMTGIEQTLDQSLAEEATALLEFNLSPEHRRKVQAVLSATDRRLTLAEVARRTGCASSTITRWWARAKRDGVKSLLSQASRRPYAALEIDDDVRS